MTLPLSGRGATVQGRLNSLKELAEVMSMCTGHSASHRRVVLALLLAAAASLPGAALATPGIPLVSSKSSYEAALQELTARTGAEHSALEADYQAGRSQLLHDAEQAARQRETAYQQARQELLSQSASERAAAAQTQHSALERVARQAAADRQAASQWHATALANVARERDKRLSELAGNLSTQRASIDRAAKAALANVMSAYGAALKSTRNVFTVLKLTKQLALDLAAVERQRRADHQGARDNYARQEQAASSGYAAATRELKAGLAARNAAIEADAATTAAALSAEHQAVLARLDGGQAAALAALDARHAASSDAADQAAQAALAALDADYRARQDALEQERVAAVAQLEAELAQLERRTQLSWSVPTVRVNGEPLAMSDLAGYELYYSSADSQHAGVIAIVAADQTAYEVTGLQPGNYLFAISAIDAAGVKSELSSPVEAHIN